MASRGSTNNRGSTRYVRFTDTPPRRGASTPPLEDDVPVHNAPEQLQDAPEQLQGAPQQLLPFTLEPDHHRVLVRPDVVVDEAEFEVAVEELERHKTLLKNHAERLKSVIVQLQMVLHEREPATGYVGEDFLTMSDIRTQMRRTCAAGGRRLGAVSGTSKIMSTPDVL